MNGNALDLQPTSAFCERKTGESRALCRGAISADKMARNEARFGVES
jgi:hypothetical protein